MKAISTWSNAAVLVQFRQALTTLRVAVLEVTSANAVSCCVVVTRGLQGNCPECRRLGRVRSAIK